MRPISPEFDRTLAALLVCSGRPCVERNFGTGKLTSEPVCRQPAVIVRSGLSLSCSQPCPQAYWLDKVCTIACYRGLKARAGACQSNMARQTFASTPEADVPARAGDSRVARSVSENPCQNKRENLIELT